MSKKVEDIDIRNRKYYFFNDISNTKKLDPNKIKINENSYKNILIYYPTNENKERVKKHSEMWSKIKDVTLIRLGGGNGLPPDIFWFITV